MKTKGGIGVNKTEGSEASNRDKNITWQTNYTRHKTRSITTRQKNINKQLPAQLKATTKNKSRPEYGRWLEDWHYPRVGQTTELVPPLHCLSIRPLASTPPAPSTHSLITTTATTSCKDPAGWRGRGWGGTREGLLRRWLGENRSKRLAQTQTQPTGDSVQGVSCIPFRKLECVLFLERGRSCLDVLRA